jgi:hypothetical protein
VRRAPHRDGGARCGLARRFELAALKGGAGGRSAVSEASPPATIDGVARVQRPSIEANIGTETARLDKPLRTVVTPLAERLERAEPELVDVAVMWLDVIADFRCPDDTALEAERAQRVFAQLVSSDSTPASRGVPLVPLRRLAANAHNQPIIRGPMYQAPRRAVRRTDGRTHQDTKHAPIARCSRLISAGKA